jgi:hypothetical protein
VCGYRRGCRELLLGRCVVTLLKGSEESCLVIGGMGVVFLNIYTFLVVWIWK